MYNLLVAGAAGDWDRRGVDWAHDRFLTETGHYVVEQVRQLTGNLETALVRLPALLVYEEPLQLPARVAWLKVVRIADRHIEVHFERISAINPIPSDAIRSMASELAIKSHELFTRHWAIKDADLPGVLAKHLRITSEHRDFVKRARQWEKITPVPPTSPTSVRSQVGVLGNAVQDVKVAKTNGKPRIFIVHGHDDALREQVARFIEQIGMEAVILHEQPNRGHTIISKFKEHAGRADFAVVLITGDDLGGKDRKGLKPRARQNVIFELGFFYAKLGAERVVALVKGDVERPSDFDGVLYIPAADEGWKARLTRELKDVGIPGNYETGLIG